MYYSITAVVFFIFLRCHIWIIVAIMPNILLKNYISGNRYALLGAASFLGGSMRMTVSLCVIMVEITNNLKLLPLIMLVLLISKVNNSF